MDEEGWAYYLLQYIYFPCTKFYIENKKNYDGFKIAGKSILVFFLHLFTSSSLHMGNKLKGHYSLLRERERERERARESERQSEKARETERE